MYKILLAPGHGADGKWYNTYYDKDGKTSETIENIEFMKYLAEYLNADGTGIKADLTHTNPDGYMDMDMKMAKSLGYDMYFPRHSNAGGGSGAELYCDVDPDYNNIPFAKEMLEAYCKATGVKNNGLKWIAEGWNSLGKPMEGYSNHFYELKNYRSDIGFLFEAFYHDNKGDISKQDEEKELRAGAKAIAEVMIKHFGTKSTKEVKEVAGSPLENLIPFLGKDGSFFNTWMYGWNRGLDHCAMGVSYAYTTAGIPIKFDYVDDIRDWFKSKNAYKTSNAQPNDVVFFDWNGNTYGDHTGIVEGVNNKYLYTLEMNAENGGINARRQYEITDKRILGYGDYNKVKNPVIVTEKAKSDVLYKVQTGAYTIKDNALKRQEELKKQGIDSFVTEVKR